VARDLTLLSRSATRAAREKQPRRLQNCRTASGSICCSANRHANGMNGIICPGGKRALSEGARLSTPVSDMAEAARVAFRSCVTIRVSALERPCVRFGGPDAQTGGGGS